MHETELMHNDSINTDSSPSSGSDNSIGIQLCIIMVISQRACTMQYTHLHVQYTSVVHEFQPLSNNQSLIIR